MIEPGIGGGPSPPPMSMGERCPGNDLLPGRSFRPEVEVSPPPTSQLPLPSRMPAPRTLTHVALVGLLAATALPPARAAAQDQGSLPRVLQLPASTRAMALGDAFMMSSESSDGVFYHPALVEGASGFGLDVQTWSGEATSASVSAATEWFGGSVAVGLQTLQYGTPTADPAASTGGQDLLFSPGSEPVSERVATLVLAREVLGMRVGLGGKLVEQRLGDGRDATAAVDVGVARDVGPFVVALSAQNLGPAMTFQGGDVSLPRRYTLGAGAYGREVGPLDVGLSASLRYREIQEDVIPAAGLEVGYWPVRGRTFVGRVGVQAVPDGEASPVSFGFAFWGDDLVLEWAWQPFGGTVDQGTHRFGVGWR